MLGESFLIRIGEAKIKKKIFLGLFLASLENCGFISKVPRYFCIPSSLHFQTYLLVVASSVIDASNKSDFRRNESFSFRFLDEVL